MNPKIKALAEKSGFYFYDLHDIDGQDMGETIEADSWKAAELFVDLILMEVFFAIPTDMQLGDFNHVSNAIKNVFKEERSKNIQFYSVENTGWSGGISWFTTGGMDMNPLRFNTYNQAEVYANKSKELTNDPNTLWRIVHTTIERTENKEVATRTWTMI